MITVMAVFAGCAQTPKTADSNDNGAAVATPESKATAATSENECKICDFDFAAYKGDLKKEEVEGLLLALNDEYHATSIYEEINKKFNNPRPFVNIVEAEKRHADMLKALFDTYKVPVPTNPWPGNVPAFDSVKSACTAGIEAEVVNGGLYDKLFKSTERQDILSVYKALQRASIENHKPAFERCASGGGGGRGNGNGKGMGRGRPMN